MIIHIGYHKTASTFLQRNLFPAMDLRFVLLDKALGREVLYPEHFDPETFRRLVLGDAADGQPVLLSGEALSGHPHGHARIQPRLVADRLLDTFPDAKILCMVREQFDAMLSLYAYRVCRKGTETRSLRRFLQDECGKGLLDKLCYDELLRYYADRVGSDRLRVLPYELFPADPRQFLAAICDFAGQAVPENIPDVQINASTRSRQVVNACLCANVAFQILRTVMQRVGLTRQAGSAAKRFYKLKARRLGRYQQKKKQHPGWPLQIPARLRHEYANRFAPSNRALEQLTGLNLEPYHYLTDTSRI